MMSSQTTHSSQPNHKNWLEWTVFGFSLALILTTIAILGSQALREEGNPASLDVELGAPSAEGSWLRVPVSVQNQGDQTAQMVVIEVRLAEGEEHFTATCTFDFVPARGAQRGVVLFPAKNAKGALSANVVGFTER